MSGNVEGGKKAAQTNKQRYGMNFFRTIGAMGGKASTGGGFASNKVDENGLTGADRARLAGAKGGKSSRRRHA